MVGKSVRTDLLRQIQTLYTVGAVGAWTDRQLLERFQEGPGGESEVAFAALVERHGPMVLRVCRDVLGDAHDVQDAFQATFLVLVSRGALLRKRDSLASWLYGVALRVAKHARADKARRRKHEGRRSLSSEAVALEEGEGPSGWPELHEEIARLPEKYRAAIVLCYLEDLTTEDAARLLGCPRGTVLSRLSRGRERLRIRLTRRGLASVTGPLGALQMPGVSTVVPEALIEATVQVVGQAGSGKLAVVLAAGAFSARVAFLAKGAMSTMISTKLKLAALGVLSSGMLAAGAGVLAQQGRQPRPLMAIPRVEEVPHESTPKPHPIPVAAPGPQPILVASADEPKSAPVENLPLPGPAEIPPASDAGASPPELLLPPPSGEASALPMLPSEPPGAPSDSPLPSAISPPPASPEEPIPTASTTPLTREEKLRADLEHAIKDLTKEVESLNRLLKKTQADLVKTQAELTRLKRAREALVVVEGADQPGGEPLIGPKDPFPDRSPFELGTVPPKVIPSLGVPSPGIPVAPGEPPLEAPANPVAKPTEPGQAPPSAPLASPSSPPPPAEAGAAEVSPPAADIKPPSNNIEPPQ